MAKSKVKAAGLKSVIHLDETQMYMTNFTKSPMELKITSDEISRISETEIEVFNAKKKSDKQYSIKSTRPESKDDAIWHYSKSSPDPLGLREKTLAAIFNNSDNITGNLHIQVAQQILDFKKLFAVYANHLEHIFDNMGGIYKDNITYAECDWLSCDFIKNKQIDKLLCEFATYRKNAAHYMTYFGIKYNPVKNITDSNKFDDDLYVMISAVSMLRNAITHTEPKAPDYILKPNCIPPEILSKMKTALSNHLSVINKDFTDRNGNTLKILQSCDSKYSAQDFYNFTLRQDYKNLGFSIRILREKILEKNPIDTKDNPTEKSRAHKVLDFIIWQKLKANAKKYQEDLRVTAGDDEKDTLYSMWASSLNLTKEIEKIQKAIKEITEGKSKNDAQLLKLQAKFNNHNTTSKQPKLTLLQTSDFSNFSIYVYYLCRCLGGHEINDLLTGLIHKFENISSFKKIWESLGNKLDFKDDFALFGQKDGKDNCKKLSDELRLLNGFVRMSNINKNKKLDKEKDPTFGREHWWHLAQVLGTTKTKEKIEEQVKDNHPLRNFISKNALESRRFQYLVKYANVASVRKFAKQNIFEFALSQIPQAQMERYYTNFDGNYAKVAEELLRIKWETFSDLSLNNKDNYIGKLRLYFTTLYLIVKNLVNINSRYVMAFWRLGFDRADCDTTLAMEYLAKLDPKSKFAKELNENLTKLCERMFKAYRNTVAHQNAIQFRTSERQSFDFTGKEKLRASKSSPQSYFALYHYMVQRCIGVKSEHNDYRKNLLKTLNAPFAYNHGRYNALSIEKLFDKNA